MERRHRATLQFFVQLVSILVLSAATWLHTWDVVDLSAVAAAANSTAVNVSSVSFSPDGVCVTFAAGAKSCQPFVAMLLDSPPVHVQRQGDAETMLTTDMPSLLDVGRDTNPAPSSGIVDQVQSSWCRASADDSTWVVQGAERVMCLALMDTCVFSIGLWALFAMLALLIAAPSLTTPPDTPTKCSLFVGYANALLGYLVVMLWWSYSEFFVDRAYLKSLELTWRYGASFYLMLIALMLSLVTLRMKTVDAGRTAPNYAQLHALPMDVSRAPSDECDPPQDPLACPPNYVV